MVICQTQIILGFNVLRSPTDMSWCNTNIWLFKSKFTVESNINFYLPKWLILIEWICAVFLAQCFDV